MKKQIYIEDINKITLELNDILEKRLKEFDVKLSEEESDKISDCMSETIEMSTYADYRNHL